MKKSNAVVTLQVLWLRDFTTLPALAVLTPLALMRVLRQRQAGKVTGLLPMTKAFASSLFSLLVYFSDSDRM